MNQNILPILFLSLPAVCGGVIALLNAPRVNDTSEKLEALTRRRQGLVSVKQGFFSKWIIHPPLRIIVKLCDWTDSLAHRGVKNGIRAAAALYVLEFWVLLVVYAFMFVLALIFAAIMVVVALWIMAQMLGDKSRSNLPTFSPKTRETSHDEDNEPAAKRKENKISKGHEHISGIIPGITPDIGHKVSDGNGHTGYGHSRSEAEAALRVAQENNREWAENDTSIIGSILPGYRLGKKLDE